MEAAALKALLRRHGLAADKGLGQHFLVSASAIDAIVRAVGNAEGVLEIGPGPGILTGPLSEGRTVVALEVDARMLPALAESAPNARVVVGNALQTDLAALLDGLPEPRATVSNLPYYITGPLLTRIAEASAGFARAVLMMQREVAERILARPGERERGSLSVYLEARFAVRLVAHVPAAAFLPPPKVDSTILAFESQPAPVPECFDRLVRIGFSQPRKTLANNLAAGLRISRDEALARLDRASIPALARPADPTLGQWIALADAESGRPK